MSMRPTDDERADEPVGGPLRVTLELARATQAEDPYAFHFTPQTYIVHTSSGGFASIEMPWNQDLLDDLQGLRSSTWEPALVQRVGERLRRLLAGTGWPLEERKIVDAVQGGRAVVLTVRSAAAELYALPWELLTIKATGQHIGELTDLVVRYEWPETTTVREQAVENGRILFAWSAAAGTVPAAAQLAAITDAAAATQYPFDPTRDVLAHASCETLVAALRTATTQRAPVTMLHLLCHGAAQGQTFGLALSGDDTHSCVVVDAGRLRQLLAPFAATLRFVVLVACDGGNLGTLGNHLGSVAQTLHRAGLQTVLASRFPLSVSGSNRLTRTLYHWLISRRETAEAAVAAARAELARDAERLDWASLQYYARSSDGETTRPLFVRPYRGLMPFRSEYAWAFFGRESETLELWTELLDLIEHRAPRFTVVAGSGGFGKTSLILAGLVPALLAETDRTWSFIEVAPGAAAVVDLATAIARFTDVPLAPTGDAVTAALHEWQSRHPERDLLVIVDPLEEVFAQAADPAQRLAFVRLLWQLASAADLRVSVVAALRIDFIGRCGDIVVDETSGLRLDQIIYDPVHSVFVAQLGGPQLRAAVALPAKAVGVDFDAGLLERIVADVDGQPGALPLVQNALALMWKHRNERRLTLATYEAIGGVLGALERHAEGMIARLDPAQLRQVRRILVRLAGAFNSGVLGAQRRFEVDKLRPVDPDSEQAFREALQSLVRARLIVLGQRATTGGGKQVTAELVHDALLHRWRRLREWVRDDWSVIVELDKIELWTVEWQQHRIMLDAQRLKHAQAVADKYGQDLSAAAHALIERSRQHALASREIEAHHSQLESKLGATEERLLLADADGRRFLLEVLELRRRIRLLSTTSRTLASLAALLLLLHLYRLMN